MSAKLSRRQRQMLRDTLGHEQDTAAGIRPDYGWGYAPCGAGFKATMKSLVRLGLAEPTGHHDSIRGVYLTQRGREIAKGLAAASSIADAMKAVRS
jgi:hypothetical protein